jgi:sterol desaturase/sphingolipid hydroxylase (fatty acid hydroxylase superfamily)
MKYTEDDMLNYVIYPSLINHLLFWLVSITFIGLDYLYERYNFLNSHRIQNKRIDWKKYKITIIYIIINQIFVNIPSFILCIDFSKNMNNIALPLYLLPFQIFGIIILEDFLFYSIHYLFHTKVVYWIHKRHHEWNVTSGLISQYCHPIEQLLCNVFPIVFCGYIFRLNWFCFNIWINLATLNAIIVHSNFNMIRVSTSHDIHHQYCKYNYGVTGMMDYLCGTKKAFKSNK